jgi:hypothetical protein
MTYALAAPIVRRAAAATLKETILQKFYQRIITRSGDPVVDSEKISFMRFKKISFVSFKKISFGRKIFWNMKRKS